MDEFQRLKLLVGDKYELLNNKTVLIIGLGGVGGYALESIVRCGIKNVIIVDADFVEASNINRQIIALNSTIGQYKTDAFEKRINDINPNCHVKKITEYINEDNINLLFEDKIDYLIDACDTINTKCLIVSECIKRKIKFITCMGTGKKLNPELLKIKELSKTSYDPIAKKMRKYVKDNHIKEKIYVVSSEEEPKKEESNIIPSISFVPGVAGLLLTSYVINDILKGEI